MNTITKSLSPLIVNAINIYLDIVNKPKHIDYDIAYFGTEGVLIPIPKVANGSSIMTNDTDENNEIMLDYINSFDGYEEVELLTKSEWLGNSFPSKEMINEGLTSIPKYAYSMLDRYVQKEGITSIDIPFIIGCLIVFIGFNDELGRGDSYNSMADWFISRFKFDMENCFNS